MKHRVFFQKRDIGDIERRKEKCFGETYSPHITDRLGLGMGLVRAWSDKWFSFSNRSDRQKAQILVKANIKTGHSIPLHTNNILYPLYILDPHNLDQSVAAVSKALTVKMKVLAEGFGVTSAIVIQTSINRWHHFYQTLDTISYIAVIAETIPLIL